MASEPQGFRGMLWPATRAVEKIPFLAVTDFRKLARIGYAEDYWRATVYIPPNVSQRWSDDEVDRDRNASSRADFHPRIHTRSKLSAKVVGGARIVLTVSLKAVC